MRKYSKFIAFFKPALLVCVALFSSSGLGSICINTTMDHDMFGFDIRADGVMRNYDMVFRDSHFSDYRFFSADKSAELATQIQTAAHSSCSVILGLFTSRECLIAGDILKKNKIVGISPVCGHDDIGKFYPYLFTGSHAISVGAETAVNYITGLQNTGKIFAIHQPANLYSDAEFTQFMQKFSKPVIEVLVDSDGKFDITKFSYSKDEPVTLVFFTYPLPAVKILIELSNKKLINKNVHLVGASSWNDDITLFTPIKSILEGASSIVASDTVDWKQVKSSAFSKSCIKKFNRYPLNVEVLSYDITRLAVKCYREAMINNKYNLDKFQHCITHTKYQGVSGTFSFGNHSSFADRPKYLTNLLDRM